MAGRSGARRRSLAALAVAGLLAGGTGGGLAAGATRAGVDPSGTAGGASAAPPLAASVEPPACAGGARARGDVASGRVPRRAVRGLLVEPVRGVEAVARPGARVGPFAICNRGSERFTVRVVPLLAVQRRSGTIAGRDDARSRERAAAAVGLADAAFELGPGGFHLVRADLLAPAVAEGFAGVLRFEATSVVAGSERTRAKRQRVRLDVPLLARPAAGWSGGGARVVGVRAVPGRDGAPRVVVAVRARAEAPITPTGMVTVRDAAGRSAAEVKIRTVPVLPGATVALAAPLARRLPAGRYTLEARLTADGARLAARGTMILGADGRLASRAATIGEIAPLAQQTVSVAPAAAGRSWVQRHRGLLAGLVAAAAVALLVLAQVLLVRRRARRREVPAAPAAGSEPAAADVPRIASGAREQVSAELESARAESATAELPAVAGEEEPQAMAEPAIAGEGAAAPQEEALAPDAPVMPQESDLEGASAELRPAPQEGAGGVSAELRPAPPTPEVEGVSAELPSAPPSPGPEPAWAPPGALGSPLSARIATRARDPKVLAAAAALAVAARLIRRR